MVPLSAALIASLLPHSPVTPTCGTPWTAGSLSVARSAKGHILLLRDANGLRLTEWNDKSKAWSTWSSPSGQDSLVSDAWIQPHVSGINNIFALSKHDGTQRIEQWLRYDDGSIAKSNGIGEADSVMFRPVCGHKGPIGQQSLFAVFRDSTIRTRVWDSLGRSWSGWSQMGQKTGRPLSLNQIEANMFNLFSLSGQTVWQNWWTGSDYHGWVVPATDGTGDDPVSVNLNYADHFLFSFAPGGRVQSRFWNGSYWTGWSPLEFPATHSLAAVTIDNDSILLYGIDKDNRIVQAGWKRSKGWSPAIQLGSCPSRPRAIDSRRLTAASTTEGILLAIRGWNDSIYHALVPSAVGSTCWKLLAGQPRILSNPWLQAPVGDINNLMVLGEATGKPRTFQWIYQHGAFQTTNGIGESDSVVSLASARLDSNGNQALFAVFQDSSIQMRVWDSIGGAWGGWSPLGNKTTRSLGVAQTASAQLNLYSTASNGDIDQLWRHDASWSGWVKPSTDSILSGPSSANFDLRFHVLFGIGTDSSLVERKWDGATWTGWSRMPWKPISEPAALVESGILHLFFVNRDSTIVHVQRTLSGDWNGASRIAGVPPTSATCSTPADQPAGLSRESNRSIAIRGSVVGIPGFRAYSGKIEIFTLDGNRHTYSKTAGDAVLPSGAPKFGFIRFAATTWRYVRLD